MKVSKEILELKPYVPGKPIEETRRELGLDKVYKLASNENPLGPSPMVSEALKKAMGQLHRYPDASFYELRQNFSRRYQIEPNQITFGNGSNELIDLLIRVFCAPGEAVLTSANAFIAYRVCALAARARFVEVPMEEDLKYNLSALASKVNAQTSKEPIRLVFIANPNNPTGTYVSSNELKSFLDAVQDQKDTLIVIDEAYLEFVRAGDYPNALSFFRDYKNVALLRTLSKVYGIAGLRVGNLVASTEIIELIDRVRNPFNVNSLAQAGALVALDDHEYLAKVRQLNWEGLDYYYEELKSMGLPFWESQTNFILMDTFRDGPQVFQALLKRGVIARPVMAQGRNTFIRLSVGLDEENRAAISALKEVLQEIDKSL